MTHPWNPILYFNARRVDDKYRLRKYSLVQGRYYANQNTKAPGNQTEVRDTDLIKQRSGMAKTRLETIKRMIVGQHYDLDAGPLGAAVQFRRRMSRRGFFVKS